MSYKEHILNQNCDTFCPSQIVAMMALGHIRSGTLGRGLMTLLTTCWSVCVLEMAKESGHASQLVSRNVNPKGPQVHQFKTLAKTNIIHQ